jgi:hypothetical protein
MKTCMVCNCVAKYVIQWGPKPDQKEYVCATHLAEAVDRIPAIEFFCVKIQKTNP